MSRSKELGRLELAVYAVLLITAGLLAWKIRQLVQINEELRAGITAISQTLPTEMEQYLLFAHGKSMPAFSLPTVTGSGNVEHTVGEETDGSWGVYIFFRLSDCPTCLDEIPYWAELGEAFGDRARIAAISTDLDAHLTRTFVESRDIQIPVALDAAGDVFATLELTNARITPLKFVVNPNGVIVHVSDSTFSNVDAQQRYRETLDRLLPSADRPRAASGSSR